MHRRRRLAEERALGLLALAQRERRRLGPAERRGLAARAADHGEGREQQSCRGGRGNAAERAGDRIPLARYVRFCDSVNDIHRERVELAEADTSRDPVKSQRRGVEQARFRTKQLWKLLFGGLVEGGGARQRRIADENCSVVANERDGIAARRHGAPGSHQAIDIDVHDDDAAKRIVGGRQAVHDGDHRLAAEPAFQGTVDDERSARLGLLEIRAVADVDGSPAGGSGRELRRAAAELGRAVGIADEHRLDLGDLRRRPVEQRIEPAAPLDDLRPAQPQ